ncbi:MAG: aryl-sulfate sulfotransferase, partial [Chloroflexota bacterium]|nr:aryl-sulfate sulfotransferase [Chloroflexota bacterium]
ERDIITFNDSRDEWSHGNTVSEVSDDRVMFSFRNISTVGMIDKASGEIVWRLGGEALAQQHDPSQLSDGNVLVYDNGSHSAHHALPFSRVIEVDPATNQIVWEYFDTPAYNFFSPYISGARRLPNGNTLITEGMFGRMFQVAPNGDVVWEYINPHFYEDAENAVVNRVFRATHYLPEEISRL